MRKKLQRNHKYTKLIKIFRTGVRKKGFKDIKVCRGFALNIKRFNPNSQRNRVEQ